MRGGGRFVRQGTLIAFVAVVLVGSLPVGSVTQGQAQTLGLGAKSRFRTLPVPPLESASSVAPSRVSSTDADSEPSAEEGPGNVQVSRNQSPADCVRAGAGETSIAGNSAGLVAGYNDGIGFAGAPFFRGACGIRQDGLSGFAFSTDLGQTWTVGGAPPVGHVVAFGPGTRGCSTTGQYVTRGDPWLDVDGDTFVYANLAEWNDNNEGAAAPCFAPAAGSVPTAGISVHFGAFQDGGFAWNRSVLLQSPNYPEDYLDKEALAIDRESGAIYITTTNFIETCGVAANGWGQIELYRSLNGGVTWDRRIIRRDETFVTNPADPSCGSNGVQNQGSAPAVGPDGELFVAWERGWQAPVVGGPPQGLRRATIAFKMSTDRGATFGPLRTIASICSQAPFPPAAFNRTVNNDFPRIAVARHGELKGRIFVTFQDCTPTNGDAAFGHNTDIFVAFSDDVGKTWTIRPAHPTADGKVHFFPVVSVGDSGEVRVAYYESREVTPNPATPNAIVCSVRVGGPLSNPILRNSTVVSLVDVIEAVSDDGGETFAPRRLTTQTTNWCKATPINSIIPNLGDYIDGRASDFGGLTLWADGRNGDLVDRIPTIFFAGGEP